MRGVTGKNKEIVAIPQLQEAPIRRRYSAVRQIPVHTEHLRNTVITTSPGQADVAVHAHAPRNQAAIRDIFSNHVTKGFFSAIDR